MARMSKEFTLVLVGAGILTAGYFLWPEDDLNAKAEKAAEEQVAGNNNGHARTHHGGMMFLWLGGGGGGSRPAAMANVSRGGFGSFGHASS